MLTVSHVVDRYRRHTGEPLTFYTRLDVGEPLSSMTLQIGIPRELAIDSYESPFEAHIQGNGAAPLLPEIARDPKISYVIWRVDREVPAGQYEFSVSTHVDVTNLDLTVESEAIATGETPAGESARAAELVSVAIDAKSSLLQYLPALYERDEMMGRFLMLFESFLSPIEGQIDELPAYVDPKMAPADLLPWLASWVDLALDERWPEERRRQLIAEAFQLYRMRGTKRGLQRYLEIYTGEVPEIIEHRADNFRLGPESRLGPGIALGRQNAPHTFTVTMTLPAAEARDDEERRRVIETIIETEKPAHTAYTLNVETRE